MPASTISISQSDNGDPGNENAVGVSSSLTGRYVTFGDRYSNLGQQNENGWPLAAGGNGHTMVYISRKWDSEHIAASDATRPEGIDAR